MKRGSLLQNEHSVALMHKALIAFEAACEASVVQGEDSLPVTCGNVIQISYIAFRGPTFKLFILCSLRVKAKELILSFYWPVSSHNLIL